MRMCVVCVHECQLVNDPHQIEHNIALLRTHEHINAAPLRHPGWPQLHKTVGVCHSKWRQSDLDLDKNNKTHQSTVGGLVCLACIVANDAK